MNARQGQLVTPIQLPTLALLSRTLVDVFEDSVRSWSANIAIDAGGATYTYHELDGAARTVAARLRAEGIGPGDRVGVCIASGAVDLYVAILGVLMAGAAYIPIDADEPDERATVMLEIASACAVIRDDLELVTLALPLSVDRETESADDAWIIFTSGSTGEPKGVAVSHAAAAQFVDAETDLWTVNPTDRVLAGLSVSFDASVEEIWLAWRNGATLVPAPRSIVRSGADLGPWVAARGITVISTVPTLASLWDPAHLEDVRLLIFGGETCPGELAWNFVTDRREVWNTYGPTEATVVTTATRIQRDTPVTIGHALAGRRLAVVDDNGVPVAPGDEGELVISGVALGRYIDSDHDHERFAPLPSLGWKRAYRTGDMVRATDHGYEFIGRRDGQVKFAGRRIELGEIDAVLRSGDGVIAVASTLQKSPAGNPVLVAYVVGDIDIDALKAYAAPRLPAGVIPVIARVDSLPLRNSGKVDRAALPWPIPQSSKNDSSSAPVEDGSITAWLIQHVAHQLGPLPMDADSNFFELGGSSLAVAKLISSLRERFPTAAVADVYHYPRIGDLAARLTELGELDDEHEGLHTTRRNRWAAVQLAGVFGMIVIAAPPWIAGILAFNNLDGQTIGPRVSWWIIIATWMVFSSAPGRSLIVFGLRWLLLRNITPGTYPRCGWTSQRIWTMARIEEAFAIANLAGTPLAELYARLTGTRVGKDVRFGSLPPMTGLCSIGDRATLENDVDAHGWCIEGDHLIVDTITVGAGARVGARCLLMPGSDVGAFAEVEPGSVVTGSIPAGEHWGGSPARYLGEAGVSWPELPPQRPRTRHFWKAMYGVGMALMALLPIVAALPGLFVLWGAEGTSVSLRQTVQTSLWDAPLVTLLFLASYGLLVALFVRCVAPLVRTGWFSDEGGVAWAYWFSGSLLSGATATLFPLYATIYTRWWLRMLGVTVGRRTEVSTAVGLHPHIKVGELSFLADDVFLASGRARDGWMHVEPIDVGNSTFLGNGALITGGTTLGERCLVGVLSSCPDDVPNGTSWLGMPPIELPRVPDAVDPSRTTNPSRRRVFARGSCEVVRILLPGTISLLIAAFVFLALDAIGHAYGLAWMVLATPFVLVVAGIVASAISIAIKWLLMGKYKPGEHPLWTFFVWRDEIVNSVHEQVAGAWLLGSALGTPVISAYLRAMGSKVGANVWCDTLALSEFDLATIGDGCVINRSSCVETHLFHDRLMRLGPVTMGAGSTLGAYSCLLPDTSLGDQCSVGGRSVVLRGEHLPPRTRWQGSPVVACSRQA